MLWAWVTVLLGSALVGTGGLLASRGWEQRSDILRSREMVRAIAAETTMNISIVNDPKFEESDDTSLQRFVIFPKLQTAALDGAIASGFFVGASDRALLTRLMRTREVAGDFNQRLILTESARGSREDLITYRRGIRDGQTRESVAAELGHLGEMRLADYGVRRDDVFFTPE
jgi:hypothetical protein